MLKQTPILLMGPLLVGLFACGDNLHGHAGDDDCSDCEPPPDAPPVSPPGCGDGVVSGAEECDDGNTTSGDGCDASCHVEPFETTAPVLISGALSCTTAVANAARKIASDSSGTIYAVMKCGTSVDVAVSRDRGVSFTPPLDLGVTNIIEVAVATGPTGTAYVAIMQITGDVSLLITRDFGATWSPPAPLGQSSRPAGGLSLETFNDDIYVGFIQGTGIALLHNGDRGTGAFTTTPVAMMVSFFDLLYDKRIGTLLVTADTPTFHVRVSTDGGATFAPEVNPPGSAFFSDWAVGHQRAFVAGTRLVGQDTSVSLYIIPTDAPSTSTSVDTLPSVGTNQSRSVAADEAGNAFVASQLDGGAGVQLDRLPFNATALDPPRALDPAGKAPVAAPLPGARGAVVIYTVGTSVYATVQAY